MCHLARFILACLAAVVVTACGKSSNQFAAGDKVRVKLTGTEGLVYLRERPFADDLYFLKVPGNPTVLYPASENVGWPSDFPMQTWHTEGPYCYTDLQRTR